MNYDNLLLEETNKINIYANMLIKKMYWIV